MRTAKILFLPAMFYIMSGITDDVLGQVGNLGKQVGTTLVDESKKMVKTGAVQVGMPEVVLEKKPEVAGVEKAVQKKPEEVLQNKDTEDFVKELYKESSSTELPKEGLQKEANVKTLEEKQKIAQLRNQLHGKYYQELVNRPKQQEERPLEKVEREKQEEGWELKEKEAKKPQPLAVTQAANKTEKFPGASG